MTLRSKKADQKGYTLVEAMVVLVIIGIIASIAIGGLTMYRRYAAFKKNNEYAQTLFSASQAVLSHAKVSGQLEALREEINTGEAGSGKLTADMIKNGADITERAVDGGLYFLCYQKGESVSGKAHQLLYDMLEPYVYDADILDATFCVEFDAVDGTVIGVVYSDMATDFSYDEGSTMEAKTKVRIGDRDREAREKILLGYYGVESLSKRAPQKSDKAFIKEIKLVNDETLYAEWAIDSDKSSITADAMQFAIQICRTYKEGKQQIIAEFTVNDGTIDENKLQKKTGKGYVKCGVWFYDEAGNKAENPLVYQFPAYIDENQNMVLALDAVDTKAEELLKINAEGGGLKKEDSVLYQNTYSVRRFTDEPENLSVKIQAYATGTYDISASAWVQSNGENAYFATASEVTDNKQTFQIANARHLFNVRFTEKAQETKTKDAVNYIYSQTTDINWGGKTGIVANGNVYTEMAKRVLDYNNKTVFPAITALASGNSYTGKGKQIENLYVADIQGPLGLFGINRGSIKNLTMKDCVITGEEAQYVGSFCGVNAGTLENLKAVGADGAVIGGNYVGGIAGSDGYGYVTADNFRESGRKRTYYGLRNEISVTGKKAADIEAVDSEGTKLGQNYPSHFTGGIIGYIVGVHEDGKKEKISFSQFVNSGDVKSEYDNNKGKSFVGGIAGYAEYVSFEMCISQDCDIEGAGGNGSNGGAAANVGGIVGYLNNGSIGIKSGIDGSGSLTVKFGNLGGIAGRTGSSANISNCHTGNGWKISSTDFVVNTGCGGIVGFSGSSGVFDSNDNSADVTRDKASDSSSGTGGIIGRQESAEEFNVIGCANYGNVSAYILSGGIIGRVKGTGGEVSACTNYGTINTRKVNGSNMEGAAGIVASVYALSWDNKLNVKGCTNKGFITSQYGGNGGIIASINDAGSNKFETIIEGCTNTGIITSAQNTIRNAGIIAYTTQNDVTISDCKNYGVGRSGEICGIVAEATSATHLRRNFGVSSCGIPIVPSGSAADVSENNYYFSKLLKQVEVTVGKNEYNKVIVETQGKEAIAQDENPIKNLTDGDISTRCSYSIATSQTPSTIALVFDKKQKLENLDLYWYDEADDPNNKEPREYEYRLYYLTNHSGHVDRDNPLFIDIDPDTKEKTVHTFKAKGHPTYQQNPDHVDLTEGLAGDEEVHGILIEILGHSHVNKHVSLYEVQANGKRTTKVVYEAEVNTKTLGTPLGLVENKLVSYAMNPDKNKRIENGMTVNPLTLKIGIGENEINDAFIKLQNQLTVVDGILTDDELGDFSQIDNSVIKSLEKITGWSKTGAAAINSVPEGEKIKKEVPEQEEPTQEVSTGGGNTDNTTKEEEPVTDTETNPDAALPQPVTEPQKQEPLKLTETILADSDIPQTALTWEEEAYVAAYDIMLQADQNEAYHYKLIKNAEGAETPYLIMHETDKTDLEGNIIWEEMPARKDDKYPKTEVLSSKTTVDTYYYPLGYSRIIDGVTTQEQEVTQMVPAETEDGEGEPQMVESTTTETVEVPCQTTVEAYLECVVYTKPDGTVNRQLYLVYPDIETAEGVAKVCGIEETYRCTYDIMITNQTADEKLYEAPAAMHWWRETDASGNWITKIREAGKENE